CPCEQTDPCELPKPPEPTDKITAPIAIGELVDKITILQIKSENIKDPKKLNNIHAELDALINTLDVCVEKSAELDAFTAELLDINKQLWDIEDDIRDKERHKRFDRKFIQLARNVYITNDKRCAVKRKINELTGSRLLEEKSYAAY
ncbi:DUF6165 family protein, partial [Candidatus Dependentiae bacterium]